MFTLEYFYEPGFNLIEIDVGALELGANMAGLQIENSTRTGVSADPAGRDSLHVVNRLFGDHHVTVSDFPIDGIAFKDISPFLGQKNAVRASAKAMQLMLTDTVIDKVLAVDARGFILGAALCAHIDAGFIMVRKPGKLPGEILSFDYTCEYRSGVLEVSRGLLRPGDRCLILDDLLATGGTARATANFAKSEGAVIVGYAFMVEIKTLNGRIRLDDAPVHSLIRC